MKSLRSRLILSHILPLLIILPLVGVVLVYIFESQVLLKNLSRELSQQAEITAQIAADQPAIWSDSQQARLFVTRFSASNRSEITLLDPDGLILASNDPNDADQVGQLLNLPNLNLALSGQTALQVNHTFDLQADVVEALVPVADRSRQILGVVRVSRQLDSVYDQFVTLRRLTLLILGAALLAAVAIGLWLAFTLERPLVRVTRALNRITASRTWEPVPEEGPREVRNLAHSFNTLLEQLRMLEDSRRRMLANLIHEVSRPIGAIQSAVTALMGGAVEQPELRQELLEGMSTQISRLRPLLDDLADLHTTVLGTPELSRRPTDVSDWLPRTALPWREAAHAKGLHWEIDVPAGLPTLNIDPDRLAQVIGNLLSNAVKYTPAGGTVTVSAAAEPDSVQIIVADTGPGIAAAEHGKIFEPFYRSNRERRFPQGMGLGLTIARDLVSAHGGQLQVASTGQGSRFTVRLPRTLTTPR